MSWTVATYVVYLAVSVPLTVWVARTLSRNGKVFLEDVFGGNHRLAEAVNTLLVVGFYLLNLGFVSLYLRLDDPVLDAAGLLEALSVKIGVVTLVLGVLHFFNVWVFNAIRRRHRLESVRAAQVGPQGYLPPPPAPWTAYPAPGQ